MPISYPTRKLEHCVSVDVSKQVSRDSVLHCEAVRTGNPQRNAMGPGHKSDIGGQATRVTSKTGSNVILVSLLLCTQYLCGG